MKKYLALLLSVSCMTGAFAQNLIDPNGNFAAVLANGDIVLGNNDPEDWDLWRFATNYTTMAGNNGYLDLAVDTDTTIDVTRPVSTSRNGSGTITVSGFSSKLVVDSNDGNIIQNRHNDGLSILISGTTGSEVILNEGIYQKTQVDGSSQANASFSGIDKLVINSVTFRGGGNDTRRNTQHGGGVGLELIGGNTIINFDEDPNENIIEGGEVSLAATPRFDLRGRTGVHSKTSGAGLSMGGTITATNLYVTSGASGNIASTASRLDRGTISLTTSTGDAIVGAAVLNMHKGASAGTTAGRASHQSTQIGDEWDINITTVGGSGMDASLSSGSSLTDVRFFGGDGGQAEVIPSAIGAATINVNAGSGAIADLGAATTITGSFTGGNAGSGEIGIFGTVDESSADGGDGLETTGTGVARTSGTFLGGNGGVITASTLTSTNEVGTSNTASGGRGFSGTIETESGRYEGGNGGIYRLPGNASVDVIANGGDGARVTGTSTISGGTFSGGLGGLIVAAGNVESSGGNGVFQEGGSLTISNGVFKGAQGRSASTAGGAATSTGGSGLFIASGTANIVGGTFTGAQSGSAVGLTSAKTNGKGIWAQNSDLTISGDAEVSSLRVEAITADSTLNLLGGTVHGSIDISGDRKTTLTVFKGVTEGIFNQTGGTVDVQLSSTNNGAAFKAVNINNGAMNFVNETMILAKDSEITLLGDTASINFAAGATLSENSSIGAGLGSISATGNLGLGNNSRISVSYADPSNPGVARITADTIDLSTSGRIIANGYSSTPSGMVPIATGTVNLGANDAEDVVQANFGWLTQITDINTAGGIEVTYDYNSLTNNRSFRGLTSRSADTQDLLNRADAAILELTNSTGFATINSQGTRGGVDLIRYSMTQMPDTMESSFKVSEQINQQLAARGTEYRSMNGYASSRPSFNKGKTPLGAAGPTDKKDDMQGWVRGYGSKATHSSDGNFSGYDSSTWGTIVGIDKSFENILIGIAGGYSSTGIDGGAAYDADVKTYHGSIYSTIGGEKLYIDIAATYGVASTEERISTLDSKSDFDANIASLYIGGGMDMDISKTWSITPEVSLLSTYYTQDSFGRTTLLGDSTVHDYDTTSYLGSLGLNIATIHQVDLLHRFALIPELRAHWLHEFNADPDDFTYTIFGQEYNTFGVRPREENLFRVGVGVDAWNWRYQRTKFEIDYDALFAPDYDYQEHIVSGRLSVKF